MTASTAPGMERRILRFIGSLRRAGVRIAPSEALDALVAAAEIALEDRAAFKAALGATLVKKAGDIGTFQSVFRQHFPDTEALAEGLRQAFGPEDSGIHDAIDGLLASESLDLDDIGELVLGRSPGPMELTVASAGLERLLQLFQIGDSSRRMYGEIDWSAIEQDIECVLEALAARGLDPAELARIRRYLQARLEALRRLVRTRAGRDLAAQAGPTIVKVPIERKSLTALRDGELTAMRQALLELARRLREDLGLRPRRWRCGRLDSRRTMRESLHYDGVPMQIVLRHRRRRKPGLVTLCDVSDSVGYASRFMLELVWALHDAFSRVRSYVFVSEIADVTETFRRHPIDVAIETMVREAPVDYHCQSDFGHAFSRFARTELDRVDSRTTVLILGDARNNYADPQEWALRRIRERAKGIIWLNPQPRAHWGQADSVMALYEPCCDVVRECRTLEQLGEVIGGLAHGWSRVSDAALVRANGNGRPD